MFADRSHWDGELGRLLSLIRMPEGCAGITTLGFETYAKHESVYVRVAIASRHDCPEHILFYLAKDNDAAVVASVFKNRSCPPLLREAIALWQIHSNDRSLVLWLEVVRQPQTPSFIRKLLKARIDARTRAIRIKLEVEAIAEEDI